MDPVVVFAAFFSVFVVLVAIRIPFALRSERRATQEAERVLADDPAALLQWKEMRATRRMRSQLLMNQNGTPPGV